VVEEGDASDAPLVQPGYTSTPWDPSPVQDTSNRPLWILRGNRIPEKVEAKGNRRKVEIPPDVTHWRHDGDREWTPLWREKPAEAVIGRIEPQ
jgi:hypothetical protein